VTELVQTGAAPPAAQRGRTTIAARVVSKAAQAATHEAGRQRHYTLATVRIHADVDASSVAYRLRVEVVYPAPVHSVASDIRQHVTTRIEELTGLTVRRLDVTVVPVVTQQTRRVE
jgi:uncharacterized alkaline shock family protein YloU